MDVEFWTSALGGLIGSGVATTVLGALLLRRSERIGAEVRSQRAYQEAALEQLFGPVKMQLGRTGRVFKRWTKRSDHIETKIVRESNLMVRDLLLNKGHLIPPSLLGKAEALIEHYDAWLEEYEELRVKQSSDSPFVFVGPKGFPFPHSAERQILDYAQGLQAALYGDAMLKG